MIDTDITVFMALFHRLRTVFPARGNPAEVEQVAGIYFNTLRGHPYRLVEEAADKIITTGKYFPKPAEWLDAIPRRFGAGLPEMSQSEARAHQRAIALGYEEDPCTCQPCTAAGVSHRFPRYVPDMDAEGKDVRMLLGGSIVARGHWAHGDELRRFYEARDVFWTRYRAQVAQLKGMPRVTQKQIKAEAEVEEPVA